MENFFLSYKEPCLWNKPFFPTTSKSQDFLPLNWIRGVHFAYFSMICCFVLIKGTESKRGATKRSSNIEADNHCRNDENCTSYYTRPEVIHTSPSTQRNTTESTIKQTGIISYLMRVSRVQARFLKTFSYLTTRSGVRYEKVLRNLA